MPTEILYDQQKNLVAAGEAVRYVLRKMVVGTSNKFLPNLGPNVALRVMCVAESREHIREDLASQSTTVGTDADAAARAMVDTWANWAGHYGCGNCGEQSAMAFVYLRDMRQIFPIDWMQINNLEHGFVVIGRAGVTNPADAATWNSEAVVCDPYKDEARLAADCRWLKARKIGLLYRQAVA